MFVSREYWRLCNSVFNKSKFSTPTFFTQFEDLTFCTNKLSLNSTFDSPGLPLPDFLLTTKSLSIDMHTTFFVDSTIISKLSSHKRNDLDVNSAIVLKQCSLELATVIF